MPVPNSPQLYRRVIAVEIPSGKEEEEEELELARHPARKYSSTSEAFLTPAEGGRTRKQSQSVTGSGVGGWHRSRERTRQSAVQRLVQRKLAQKEKEKEKERDRSWAGSRNVNSSQNGVPSFPGRSLSREGGGREPRDVSGTRSENGFMLGSGRASSPPSKENIKPGTTSSSCRFYRTSRSCSGTRYKDVDGAEESTTKTYITIGPGKPTRIREHSPSKSAKLTSDETVTSARERSAQSTHSSPLKVFDLNRSTSPSPQRKQSASKAEVRNTSSEKNKEFLRTTSPLKSTNILKSFQSTDSDDSLKRGGRKISFVSEKTIHVNQVNNKTSNKRERRLSIEILKTAFKTTDGDELKRASVESENSSSNRSSLSSLSGSSDSGVETDRPPVNLNIHLSQRRISLEQRFQARARISSPERSQNLHQVFSERSSSRFESNTVINEFHSQRSSNGVSDSRKPSSASELNVGPTKPIPASRKISLPQPAVRRPEPAPRRRSSLHTIVCTDRLAEEKKEEGNQLYKLKSYRDALAKYSEAIDLCPQCASFYGNRSACYLMLGQPRQALEDAKTSTSLDPAFEKGWTRLARCCVLMGDTVTARQALTKLGELGGENVAEQRNVDLVERLRADGQQAYQSGDFRRSLYCIDKALEVSTHSLSLKASRAECLAFLGRYSEASETANAVLQFDNLNADAIYVRGLCLYYEDNVDRAFSHFTQVLRFAPDHVKAKEIYKKAKSLKQKKEEGNAEFKAGNLDEAYKLYSEALSIDPHNRSTNAKLYFNRATVAAKLKKHADAIADCDKALELDSGYTKALLRRAKSCMEMEQYEDAVRDYEKVHKADRSNMEYRHLLQEAKLELKKSKRKDYYKILSVDKTANEEEIKKAYRKRAMIHHPDRHSGATEAEKKDHEHKFKEVVFQTNAHLTLTSGG